MHIDVYMCMMLSYIAVKEPCELLHCDAALVQCIAIIICVLEKNANFSWRFSRDRQQGDNERAGGRNSRYVDARARQKKNGKTVMLPQRSPVMKLQFYIERARAREFLSYFLKTFIYFCFFFVRCIRLL